MKYADDLFWLLDHYLIHRSNGDVVLNGTPEEFEDALRKLLISSQKLDK